MSFCVKHTVMDIDADRQRQEEKCLQDHTPEGPDKGPWITSFFCRGVTGKRLLLPKCVWFPFKSQMSGAAAIVGAGCNQSSRPHSLTMTTYLRVCSTHTDSVVPILR